MSMRTVITLLNLGLIGATASGQTAGMLSFQGVLKDVNGNPLNGSVDIEFQIYDSAADGKLIAGPFGPIETEANGGVLTVDFGPVPIGAFDGTPRWLAVTVNGEKLLPRTRLVTAPYADKSGSAENLTVADALMPAVVIDPDGTIDLRGTMRLRDPQGSPGNRQIDLTGGYGLWRDDSGAGSTNTRLWLETPDGGEIVLGPRAGSAMTDLLRLRARRFRFDSGFPSFDGNSLYIRNLQAPATLQTWGLVVSTTNGRLSIGPSTDVPAQGQLTRSVVTIAPDAPQSSLLIENDGSTSVNILRITGGADLAEPFDVASRPESDTPIKPGMVVVIDPDRPGKLKIASEPYDPKAVGVISGANGLAPGMVMKAEGQIADGEHPVALAGRVYVWADASYGAIQPGDMLTTSATSGHAMKATDRYRSFGTVIGKAMEPLPEGRRLVLMLVQPR